MSSACSTGEESPISLAALMEESLAVTLQHAQNTNPRVPKSYGHLDLTLKSPLCRPYLWQLALVLLHSRFYLRARPGPASLYKVHSSESRHPLSSLFPNRAERGLNELVKTTVRLLGHFDILHNSQQNAEASPRRYQATNSGDEIYGRVTVEVRESSP